MLRVWKAPYARPTMDIDMLGRTVNQPEAVAEQIAEIAHNPVTDDGMKYDTTTLRTEAITEDSNYQGLRARLHAELSGARVALQLDIGFGDALVPGASRELFPTLLDLPAPSLLCFRTINAEDYWSRQIDREHQGPNDKQRPLLLNGHLILRQNLKRNIQPLM